MNSRVFIPEPNERFSFQEAEKHGSIVYLSSKKTNPFNTSRSLQIYRNSFIQNNFDPARDFLCMTGNSLSLCLALSCASYLYDEIKVLMFDSQTSHYIVRIFTSPKKEFANEQSS